MYLSHFGLSEPPFRITPHTDFFFSGARRGATLEALIYAITHDEGIVKVSGEVGSGKTMLCRVLMERLPQSIETIYLANPSLAREEILFAIADELNLQLTAERSTRLLKELQDHLIKLFSSGKRVVVLIDEAHAMPKDTLEEIRLLSNLETGRQKLLQIVLFGQPELDEHLGAADMRQLKERITHSFRLEPMVRDDIEGYIDFRMRAAGYRGPKVFSPKSIRLIASASEGLTRRINILADKCLLAAFAHNTHGVTEKEAGAAIRDSDFFRPRFKRSRYLAVAAALLGGVAIGWGIQRIFSPILQDPLPAQAASAPGAASQQVPAQPQALAQAPVTATSEAAAITPATEPVTRVNSTKGTAELIKQPAKAPEAGPEKAEGGPQEGEVRLGKLTQERFNATQIWLESTPNRNYSVQLITVKASDSRKMEDFLLRAAKLVNPQELHVYSVKIDGQQHYRVAYGSFQSNEEVQFAIKELPQFLKSQNPYQRTVERMRSQNRQ